MIDTKHYYLSNSNVIPKTTMVLYPSRQILFPWEVLELPESSTKIKKYLDPGLRKHQEVSSTPCDKIDKIDCGFLGPSWCNKKVNPETYVSCGSYQG